MVRVLSTINIVWEDETYARRLGRLMDSFDISPPRMLLKRSLQVSGISTMGERAKHAAQEGCAIERHLDEGGRTEAWSAACVARTVLDGEVARHTSGGRGEEERGPQ